MGHQKGKNKLISPLQRPLLAGHNMIMANTKDLDISVEISSSARLVFIKSSPVFTFADGYQNWADKRHSRANWWDRWDPLMSFTKTANG